MKRTSLATMLLACAPCVGAQGTFQNLDFEAAVIVQAGGSIFNVVASNALPSWSAFAGGARLDVIRYNDSTTIPEVGLYGPDPYVLEGNFSLWLSGTGSINQTATVPAEARSLLFETDPGRLPLVTLDGQALSCIVLSNAPTFSIYGADVSPFAGHNATLAFASGWTQLDDIRFSPEIVPEPVAAATFGLGLALLVARCWGRSGRTKTR